MVIARKGTVWNTSTILVVQYNNVHTVRKGTVLYGILTWY